ncbi:MAG: YccT family protein [Pseudomonadales bacterium]|jgi:uncharacterized protein YccT (UPF0319 family)
MKIVSTIATFLVFLFSSCSFADVYLKLDDDIKLLAINGKELADASWLDNQEDISLKDGVNQILVEFSAEIKTSSSESDLESLGTYIIVFKAASERFRLVSPTIKNRKDFLEFKKHPKWVMLDASGAIKDIRVDELTKEGFQLSRDYESELREYNESNFSSEVYSEKHEEISIRNSSVINTNPILNDPNLSGRMLKYWYLNASPKVKADFIAWTKE